MLLEISYPHGGEQQDLPLLGTESFPKSFMDIGGDKKYLACIPPNIWGICFQIDWKRFEKYETIRFDIRIGFRILDKKCNRIVEFSLKLI